MLAHESYICANMTHIQNIRHKMIKDQVLSACRFLLGPVIRILLRNGVGWREFADLAKEIYVETARHDYGVQGRPTNVARVAMMTGLSRREVTRVRNILDGEALAPLPASSRISAVLTAWHVDTEFTDADGSPALLPESGETASLDALLNRYLGDLPRGAFLKELQQLGLIEKRDTHYKVLKRDYVREASDPDLIRQAGLALHDHGRTLAHNVNADRSDPARFERMSTSLRLAAKHIGDFHSFLASKGQAFLEDTDAWLSAHSLDAEETKVEYVRAGLGMYLIQDEIQRGRADD